jgi:16S rRNA C967 or C1407 C5-methylase (RsmB/RsmF family)
MLYATCSAYACENEDIVQAFVTEQQEANLLFDRYLNASPQGGDTMYAALVHKAVD